jgi:hypothetical protein
MYTNTYLSFIIHVYVHAISDIDRISELTSHRQLVLPEIVDGAGDGEHGNWYSISSVLLGVVVFCVLSFSVLNL